MLIIRLLSALNDRARVTDEGQTTTEYALVLTAVAAVVALFGAWAIETNKVTKLFDVVFERVIGSLS